MSSPRPSWRRLLAATGGLFLVILAFLAGQLKAGGDPALGGTAATSQEQTTPPGFGGQEGSDEDDGDDEDDDGDDGDDEGDDDDGFIPDGFIPDGFIPGGSAPASPVPDGSGDQSRSSDAPSTHQS